MEGIHEASSLLATVPGGSYRSIRTSDPWMSTYRVKEAPFARAPILLRLFSCRPLVLSFCGCAGVLGVGVGASRTSRSYSDVGPAASRVMQYLAVVPTYVGEQVLG